MRAGFDAELLARRVVEHDDLAPDLGPFGQWRSGPRDMQLEFFAVGGVPPGAAVLVGGTPVVAHARLDVGVAPGRAVDTTA